MAARALINVPPKAKRGEIIGIKSLISHEMETGFRPNASGQLIPRDIITEFVCTYNGVEVFRAEFFPKILVTSPWWRPRGRRPHDHARWLPPSGRRCRAAGFSFSAR
jgi:hypothetical protein